MQDHEGFEAWYAEQYPRLVLTLSSVTNDRQEAEEAAAEACARCLERWGTANQPRDPSAWTYTVGVNLVRRRWRRRQREQEHLIAQAPPHGVEIDLPALELWSAVAELAPRVRMAVMLRYVGGLGEQEIATAMKISVGAVSKMLNRARGTLAERLRDVGLEPGPDRDGAHG